MELIPRARREPQGDLRYARKSGGSWFVEVVDDTTDDVGAYSSIALDAQGNPHISYFHNGDPKADSSTVGDLKYAKKVAGNWIIETAAGSQGTVGLYTSIAIDNAGRPHVGYWDAALLNPKYAVRDGKWQIQAVDGSPNLDGQFASIELDAQGDPHISYFDLTKADLRYARGSSATHVLGAGSGDRLLHVWPNPSRGDAINVAFGRGRAASTHVGPAANQAANASVAVFDAGGRLVRTLVSHSLADSPQVVSWDGRTESGASVSAGHYFVSLALDGVARSTQRITIVR